MHVFGKIFRPYGDNLTPGNGMLYIRDGGTSSYELRPEFLEKINSCYREQIDVPYGIAGLGPDGIIPYELIDSEGLDDLFNNSVESFHEFGWCQINEVIDLYLLNYRTNREYVITTTAGTVVMEGRIITFTAPSTPQLVTIKINEYTLYYAVVKTPVATPVIIDPENGRTGLRSSYLFRCSEFKGSVPAVKCLRHTATSWEINESEDFSSEPFLVINEDNIHLTHLIASGMEYEKTYYIRAKHYSTLGYVSEWSEGVKFTIDKIVVGPPKIIYPVDVSTDNSIRLEATCTPYRPDAIGQTVTSHIATDWELALDSNFNNIYRKSYNDTTHLTQWTQTRLDFDQKYWIRCRHRNSQGKIGPWGVASSFTTCSPYITPPEINGIDTRTNPNKPNDPPTVWPSVVNIFDISDYDDNNKATYDTLPIAVIVRVYREGHTGSIYTKRYNKEDITDLTKIPIPVGVLAWNNEVKGNLGKYKLTVQYVHDRLKRDTQEVISEEGPAYIFYTEHVVVSKPSITACPDTAGWESIGIGVSHYYNGRTVNNNTQIPIYDSDHVNPNRVDYSTKTEYILESDSAGFIPNGDSTYVSTISNIDDKNIRGNEDTHTFTGKFFTPAEATSGYHYAYITVKQYSSFYKQYTGKASEVYATERKAIKLNRAGFTAGNISVSVSTRDNEKVSGTGSTNIVRIGETSPGQITGTWSMSPMPSGCSINGSATGCTISNIPHTRTAGDTFTVTCVFKHTWTGYTVTKTCTFRTPDAVVRDPILNTPELIRYNRVTITAGGFASNCEGRHTKTEWFIRKGGTPGNSNSYNGASTTNLTSITFSNLDTNCTYYIGVKFYDQWGTASRMVTKSISIPAPKVTLSRASMEKLSWNKIKLYISSGNRSHNIPTGNYSKTTWYLSTSSSLGSGDKTSELLEKTYSNLSTGYSYYGGVKIHVTDADGHEFSSDLIRISSPSYINLPNPQVVAPSIRLAKGSRWNSLVATITNRFSDNVGGTHSSTTWSGNPSRPSSSTLTTANYNGLNAGTYQVTAYVTNNYGHNSSVGRSNSVTLVKPEPYCNRVTVFDETATGFKATCSYCGCNVSSSQSRYEWKVNSGTINNNSTALYYTSGQPNRTYTVSARYCVYVDGEWFYSPWKDATARTLKPEPTLGIVNVANATTSGFDASISSYSCSTPYTASKTEWRINGVSYPSQNAAITYTGGSPNTTYTVEARFCVYVGGEWFYSPWKSNSIRTQIAGGPSRWIPGVVLGYGNKSGFKYHGGISFINDPSITSWTQGMQSCEVYEITTYSDGRTVSTSDVCNGSSQAWWPAHHAVVTKDGNGGTAGLWGHSGGFVADGGSVSKIEIYGKSLITGEYTRTLTITSWSQFESVRW